jgi:hypothetical protein
MTLKMRWIVVVVVFAIPVVFNAHAQSPKNTLSFTETGVWYSNCVDEMLEGEITLSFSKWNFNSQLRYSLKQKATLTGTESGDVYTLTSIEKIRFRVLDSGMMYAKSGILNFSIDRNGEFWAFAHTNAHVTFNAKGELVVHVDHRIECE